MAKNRLGGAFYSTDDLLKMAQLGNFGNYSPVLYRALTRLKNLEIENSNLKETISSYEKIDEIKEVYENYECTNETPPTSLDDLQDIY